jgi:hypothetical protein
MISFNTNVRIEPSARSFLAGSCHTVTVNGTYWSDPPTYSIGSAITPYSMNDYTLDAATVQQLVPSWAYGGAYIKRIYSEVSPKNTSTADNKCLILYVSNVEDNAQWVFSILKRGSAATSVEGQGIYEASTWSYLDLFLTPTHYTNPISRDLTGYTNPPETWQSGGDVLTKQEYDMYLNGCVKDLNNTRLALAPGDGVYSSLSIT